MARIPVYQERQAVGQLVAIPELSAVDTGAGLMGKAMSQVGGALNKMANTQANILQRDAKTWATETSTEELLYWTKRTEELKATMPPGGAGYAETLNKEMNTRWNKILADAPNDISRNFLNQNFLTLRKTLLADGLQFQVIESRAKENQSLDKKSDAIALVAAQTKNPTLMQQQLGQFNAEVDASTSLSPKQKEEKKLNASRLASTALAQSITKDSPQIALEILQKTTTNLTGNYDKEKLYLAQQTVESGNNPKAVSEKGATGLMQVMPETAMKPGFNLPNIFDFAISQGKDVTIRDEIAAKELLKDEKIGQKYGRAYMDAMLKEFNGNVIYALAGYNWGPNATKKWINDGADFNALPEQTRNYIPKVLNIAGITGADAGQPKDSVFAMLPLGEQLKLLNQAKENESAQFSESIAGATWSQYGPKSDTDPIELDVLNAHVDVAMASRTVEERRVAKTLVKEYAAAHTASANQRLAERDSAIWQKVMGGEAMATIQSTPEWKSLDGRTQAKLIGEINSFRTQPTTPAQTARYYDLTSNPQKLAGMSEQEVMVAAGSLGRELGNQLVKDRAKLRTPEDIGKAQIDDDLFKRFATEAGLKPYTAKTEEEKKKVGELKYAFEREVQAQQNVLKRPLNRNEIEDAMFSVLNNKVFVDEAFKDPQVPLALVARDDYDDTYVRVGEETVYLKQIPASSRDMIVRQLREAGEPVTESEIARIWLQGRKLLTERIPK